jgi:uncharacterized protein
MNLQIPIRDTIFTLDSSGAIYWEEKKMLLIADVHLGKVTHFRKNGIPIPEEKKYENFQNLDKIVTQYNPETICFLGDLFHSSLNSEWHLFEEWVVKTNKEIILVSGNHDIIDAFKFIQLNIKIYKSIQVDSFLLTHYPTETEDYFNFCGHIHPAVILRGIGKQKLKLACFFQTKNQMILPAFGEFTGKYILVPNENDTVYGVGKGEIFTVNF